MMQYTSIVLLICCSLVALVQAGPEDGIPNGVPAVEGQFPHQILMNRSDGMLCGGSIISRNYILTAAHCVCKEIDGDIYLVRPKKFTIIAGSNNVANGRRFGVAHFIVHEGYERAGIHDIALMKLAKPLTFSYDIRPISLSRQDPPPGTPLIISGYGDLHNSKSRTRKLQWIVVLNFPTETCKSSTYASYFWDSILCLGHDVQSGYCFGDSGGPATLHNELVGICSIGSVDCNGTVPDIYTSVVPYLDWIEEHSDYKEFKRYS